MFVGQRSNDGTCNGLAEREERAECAAEEDNVVAVVDWLRKGILVGIQEVKCVCENRGRGRIGILSILYAVKLEELRKQREDEGERYL